MYGEKKIRRRRTELGDICETHGLCTERARQHGARNKHLHLLLIDIAFASSQYKLKKLQYQKYKTEKNL